MSIGTKCLMTILMARIHSMRRVKRPLKTGFARLHLWDTQLMAVTFSEVTLRRGWLNKKKKEKLNDEVSRKALCSEDSFQ